MAGGRWYLPSARGDGAGFAGVGRSAVRWRERPLPLAESQSCIVASIASQRTWPVHSDLACGTGAESLCTTSPGAAADGDPNMPPGALPATRVSMPVLSCTGRAMGPGA
jgi:hypothetical protein